MNTRLIRPAMISIGLYVIFLLWWVILSFWFGGQIVQQNLYWAASYQVITWWAGIFGLYSARFWGGLKSTMGRAVTYFSIGIALQAFGQTTFSIYTTFLNVELPYPSIADIGYFGSILFYILGAASIAKVGGTTLNLKNSRGKVLAIIVPAAMLAFSYSIFLRGYEFDWSAPLRVVLDFGYPLGEAIYVSLAILALILSRNVLGGIMREPLIYLIFALIAQYIAEFNFLYQASNETWMNGGYGDVLYLTAYFLMALSLAKIYDKLRSQDTKVAAT